MKPNLRIAVVLAIASLACGEGSGPRPFTAAFVLSTVNGSPPPVLVGASLNCDQYLDSAQLNLFDDGTFALQSHMTLDCTAAGGSVSAEQGTITGTYSRKGSTISLQVPGASPVSATYTGSSLAGTIPASSVTFPTALDLVFLRLLPL